MLCTWPRGDAKPIIFNPGVQSLACKKRDRSYRFNDGGLLHLRIFGCAVTECRRQRNGLRSEQDAQLVQLNRLGDIKKVQNPKIAL